MIIIESYKLVRKCMYVIGEMKNISQACETKTLLSASLSKKKRRRGALEGVVCN